MWSFRRPGGSGTERASSDAAAILFFLKEEKEKNGGAKTLHSLSTKECGMWKPELLKSV